MLSSRFDRLLGLGALGCSLLSAVLAAQAEPASAEVPQALDIALWSPCGGTQRLILGTELAYEGASFSGLPRDFSLDATEIGFAVRHCDPDPHGDLPVPERLSVRTVRGGSAVHAVDTGDGLDVRIALAHESVLDGSADFANDGTSIGIGATPPPDHTYAVASYVLDGHVALQPSTRARLFADSSASVRDFVGPVDGAFTVPVTVPPAERIFAACGKHWLASINLGSLLREGASSASAARSSRLKISAVRDIELVVKPCD